MLNINHFIKIKQIKVNIDILKTNVLFDALLLLLLL